PGLEGDTAILSRPAPRPQPPDPNLGRDVRLQKDVGHLEPTDRLQHPEHFARHPRLVRSEVEAAVGGHQIDRGVRQGQPLDPFEGVVSAWWWLRTGWRSALSIPSL